MSKFNLTIQDLFTYKEGTRFQKEGCPEMYEVFCESLKRERFRYDSYQPFPQITSNIVNAKFRVVE